VSIYVLSSSIYKSDMPRSSGLIYQYTYGVITIDHSLKIKDSTSHSVQVSHKLMISSSKGKTVGKAHAVVHT
jgi:hypothetical protein